MMPGVVGSVRRALVAMAVVGLAGVGGVDLGAGAGADEAVGAPERASIAAGRVEDASEARLAQGSVERLYLPLTGSYSRSDLLEAAERPGGGWVHFGATGSIRDLAVDERRGVLWAATDGGLLRWHPGDDTRLRVGFRPVGLVAVDRAGQVWYGGGDTRARAALQVLEPGTGVTPAVEALPLGSVVAIEADPAGGVWVAIAGRWLSEGQWEGGGLLRVEADGRQRLLGVADGLPSSNLAAVAADGQGGAWLAFRDHVAGAAAIGVAHLAAGGFVTVEGAAEGLSRLEVHALAVAPDGTVLALAEGEDSWDRGGLFERRADGRWREAAPPRALAERLRYVHDDVSSFAISQVAVDGAGSWWLLAPGGLFTREPDGRWTLRPEADEALAEALDSALWSAFYQPAAFALGADGSVWLAGARRPLVGWSSGSGWSLHEGEGDLPTTYASSLAMDGAGRPWLLAGQAHRLERDGRWRVLEDARAAGEWDCGGSGGQVAVARAPDGSVWVGDQDAVWQVRPDGARVRQGAGMGVGRVWVIAFATDGGAWVGGTRGLARQLPSGDWQRFGRADGLPSDHVEAIAFDRQGRIWVGTRPALRGDAATGSCLGEGRTGLAYLPEGGGWTSFEDPPGGDPDRPRWGSALAFGPDGLLRVALGPDLFVISSEGAWQEVSSAVGLEGWHEVSALDFDREGNLWIATAGDGVRRVRPDGSWDAFGAGGGKIGDQVRAVHAAEDGSVWFGLAYGGLDGARLVRRLPDGQWLAYADGWDAWWSHEIVSIVADAAGRVWCGTGQDRLYRWQEGRGFDVLVAHDRLGEAGRQVADLAPDGAGGLWLGSRDGLMRRAPDGRVRSWHRAEGLPSAVVTRVEPEPGGRAWVGFGWRIGAPAASAQGGIGRVDAEGRFEDHSDAAGLRGLQVASLALGERGQLLVALQAPGARSDERVRDLRGAGIASRDTSGRWSRQEASRGLPSDEVRAVAIADEGRLWIATDLGLAWSDDGRAWQVSGEAEGLPSADARVLAVAPDGALWAGTAAGAARLGADGRWQELRPDDGPASVIDLALDPAGNAWLLLDHGSVRSVAVKLR